MPYAYVQTHQVRPRRNRSIPVPYGELRWAPSGVPVRRNAPEAVKAQRVILQKGIRAGQWVGIAVKVANDLEDSGHTQAAEAVALLDAPAFRSFAALYRYLEESIGTAAVGDVAQDLHIAFACARG
jgi:hypothetical protein